MTVAALRPAIIGLVLLAPAGIRPAAAEPDLCQADGSPFWLSRMGDRSNEAALPAPTQAGMTRFATAARPRFRCRVSSATSVSVRSPTSRSYRVSSA
jgi:hypothetical protein